MDLALACTHGRWVGEAQFAACVPCIAAALTRAEEACRGQLTATVRVRESAAHWETVYHREFTARTVAEARAEGLAGALEEIAAHEGDPLREAEQMRSAARAALAAWRARDDAP